MQLSDARTMRDADNRAIHALGIPSTLLMRNAAAALARGAQEYLGEKRSAVVVCGTGNNGGDGVAAAAWLLGRGAAVRAFLVGDREKMTADTREMERRLQELGGQLEPFGPETLTAALSEADVAIDALFGIGLSRPLTGAALEAVQRLNAAGVPVVSADIASGVSADTGEILGDAVRAARTVTFSMAKPGHFAAPGCICRGELDVAPIGIPGELLKSCGVSAVTRADVHLPARDPLSHKGDFGRLLIVGGSVGYTGAPSLCAMAALRAGAGLVSLGVPEPIYTITAVKNTEAMPFPLVADEAGRLSPLALPALLERLEKADAAVLGPGLGRSEALTALMSELMRCTPCPLVLDADALFALGSHPAMLREAARPVILTPHAGEFARLGGGSGGDRTADALAFAREYGCCVVLKGHATVCAFPDGEAFLNTTGGPALAKGGSGDVLAGIIGALLCRLPLREAVVTAVWLHGRAGDLCAGELGEDGVLATDVIGALPRAMTEIRERKN